MAPKRNTPQSTLSSASGSTARKPAPAPSTSGPAATTSTTTKQPHTTSASAPSSSSRATKPSPAPSSSALSPHSSATEILTAVWNSYVSRTAQRVKLLDAFMAFLVAVGVLQFAYCVVGGNYPFNAFLSGFSATVGQFVLTASLRIQTNVENRAEFKAVSHERAFADYVFGSLILHFFCVNFIN